MTATPLNSTRLQPSVIGAPESGAVSTDSAHDGQTVETVRPRVGVADTRLKPGANEKSRIPIGSRKGREGRKGTVNFAIDVNMASAVSNSAATCLQNLFLLCALRGLCVRHS